MTGTGSPPPYSGMSVLTSIRHERPRHPNDMRPDEVDFVTLVRHEVGQTESAVISGWLRGVITDPHGVSQEKLARIGSIAKRIKFKLSKNL